MKATDLMVGDYVFWNWVTHKVDFDGDVMTDRGYEVSRRIIKVSSVNDAGVTFKSLKDGSQISIKEEDLAPIPLTEEILEKNGFEIDKNFKNSNYKKNVYILAGCVKWKDNVVFVDITSESEGSVLFLSSCKYVHQLQHLLKDLEIEKEIVLCIN